MSSSAMIGLLVFLGMIVLVMLGFNIFVAMLSASIIGFMIMGGPQMVTMQFTNAIINLSNSYTYAVVPLFMVVGTLAGETGIASGAFTSMKKWLGRFRGGLLYATIGANTLFGACSGVSSAGNVVFSQIALPELEKSHYNKNISMGCICASGCLSSLIPPSVPIITFCLLTNLFIGTALVYGTAGGVFFTVLMFVAVKVIGITMKGKIPPVTEEDKQVTWKERFGTLKLLLPIVCLFALIVGGSFFGWFPATVGGAVAMSVIIIYALFKHMSPKKILNYIWDGVTMFGSLMIIIICGSLFSRFIALTGLAASLANVIAELSMPAFIVFLIVLVFYLFCGCVMELMSILIITIPIVFPLLTGLGFNPYVLCIMLVFIMDMAQMTPPIGLGVFTVAGVLRINPSEIFKGVWPWFLTELAAVILLAIFPQLISWLPTLLGA